MKTPTHSDLERILWSDPASECFAHDAREILASKPGERTFNDGGDAQAAIQEILDVVCAELDAPSEDDGADALRDQAVSAKRGAILLLHAAWAAEEALAEFEASKKRPSLPAEDPRQLKIGGA